MIEVRSATKEEIRSYLGFLPRGIRFVSAAVRDGEIVAMSGVVRDPLVYGSILEEEGRWIAFLDVTGFDPREGVRAVKAIAQRLKSLNDEIWVYCETKHPKAERLLAVLGFQPTDEIRPNWRNYEQKLRMWKWPKPFS